MYQPRRASDAPVQDRPVPDAFHVGPRRAAVTRTALLRSRLAPAAVSLTMLATAGAAAMHLGTQQGLTGVPSPTRDDDDISRSMARNALGAATTQQAGAAQETPGEAWADEVPPEDAPDAMANEPVVNQAFLSSSWADSFGTLAGTKYAQADVQIHEQATGDSPALGKLAEGDKVTVTDKVVDGFVQVAFEARIGYVRAGQLGAEPPKSAPEVVPMAARSGQDKPAADTNATLFWPTAGTIGSPWGMRKHPILGYTRMHGGVDIGGRTGQPIYAAEDGVVTKAAYGYNGGSGNNIRINHGKIGGKALETGYLHMSELSVKVGQQVKRGQVIGTMGNTGLSTGPHLHFSLYINGTNSDPAPWLR